MRYRESRERSAELLRLALARMGQHPAALNPVTFAVWYEHLSGANAALSGAIETAERQLQPLDDALVERLYAAHVAEIDADASQRIRDEFKRVMKQLAESAATTGAAADAYGRTLDGLQQTLSAELPDGSGAALLGPQLTKARSDTSTMRASVAALERQVQHGQQEIDRLRHDLERAREEAFTDALTRLLNRRGFEMRLDSLLRLPVHEHAAPGLILIDVDHFKRVNDQHGHTTGDRVLQGLGEILRATAPSQQAHCARYGGEEFAVLLESTSTERAVRLADTLRASAAAMKLRHRQTQEVMLTVTVSAGVALRRSGEDGESLLARADKALYRSKEDGRNRTSLSA